MTNPEWRPVQGILMTSEPIEAYGGLSISAEMLRNMAQHLNIGGVPFHADHKLSQPIRMRRFEAFVASRPDGVDVLNFRAEIHEDDQHWLESRPGVSATITAPLPRDESEAHIGDSPIRISADHAWFDDDALMAAEAGLLAQGIGRELLRVERAYQFSFVPDPQIFIEVAYTILLSMGSNALWDGVKKIFSRRRTPRGGDERTMTTLNISMQDGDRSLNAVISTNDEGVAERAMDSLDQAFTSFFADPQVSSPEGTRKAVTVWDDESRDWTPPN